MGRRKLKALRQCKKWLEKNDRKTMSIKDFLESSEYFKNNNSVNFQTILDESNEMSFSALTLYHYVSHGFTRLRITKNAIYPICPHCNKILRTIRDEYIHSEFHRGLHSASDFEFFLSQAEEFRKELAQSR